MLEPAKREHLERAIDEFENALQWEPGLLNDPKLLDEDWRDRFGDLLVLPRFCQLVAPFVDR